MKPTLLVLAAGMGSRYGGLKQLDGIGPHGETIMDYSVYDAAKAGFGKVVFVIRHDFEDDFRNVVLSRYNDFIPVELAFQATDVLPEGYTLTTERTKPWGTGHAVYMGKDVVSEPFAVINADDYYGRHAFKVLGDILSHADNDGAHYCMVGFKVGKTMTENGSVSRGVCSVDADSHLQGVVERRDIAYMPDHSIAYTDEVTGEKHPLEADTLVSMNMWGFTPGIFSHIESQLREFLDVHLDSNSGEFYIPSVVDRMIKDGDACVDVLGTDSQWFGVTYAQDRPGVAAQLKHFHEDSLYPEDLFGE